MELEEYVYINAITYNCHILEEIFPRAAFDRSDFSL